MNPLEEHKVRENVDKIGKKNPYKKLFFVQSMQIKKKMMQRAVPQKVILVLKNPFLVFFPLK